RETVKAVFSMISAARLVSWLCLSMCAKARFQMIWSSASTSLFTSLPLASRSGIHNGSLVLLVMTIQIRGSGAGLQFETNPRSERLGKAVQLPELRPSLAGVRSIVLMLDLCLGLGESTQAIGANRGESVRRYTR